MVRRSAFRRAFGARQISLGEIRQLWYPSGRRGTEEVATGSTRNRVTPQKGVRGFESHPLRQPLLLQQFRGTSQLLRWITSSIYTGHCRYFCRYTNFALVDRPEELAPARIADPLACLELEGLADIVLLRMHVALGHGNRAMAGGRGDCRQRYAFGVRQASERRMSHDIRNEGTGHSLQCLGMPVADSFPVGMLCRIRSWKDPFRDLAARRDPGLESRNGRLTEPDFPDDFFAADNLDLALREMKIAMPDPDDIGGPQSGFVSKNHDRAPGLGRPREIGLFCHRIRNSLTKLPPQCLFVPVDDTFFARMLDRVFL